MPDFNFRHPVPVRFADLDVLGHVNHIAYLEILEVGRIAYYFQVLGMRSARDINFVLAEQRIRYLASATLDQTLVVGFRIEWLRTSSSGYSFEIRAGQSDQLLCTGEGVQVLVDLATSQPMAIPESYRARIRAFEGRPFALPERPRPAE